MRCTKRSQSDDRAGCGVSDWSLCEVRATRDDDEETRGLDEKRRDGGSGGGGGNGGRDFETGGGSSAVQYGVQLNEGYLCMQGQNVGVLI